MLNQLELPSSESLRFVCARVRRSLLQMAYHSKSSHLACGLSMVESLVVLYFRTLKIYPREPNHPQRDRFILSKAHGSAALYATLAERGFFGRDLLAQYCVNGGALPGHLDHRLTPGVEVSGGSLGHGLGIGIGMALAGRADPQAGRVFVLLGDGECNEGSVWEGIMLAAQLKLENLTVLVDFNGQQALGASTGILDQSNLADRFRAFGWHTKEVDGHDLDQLSSSFGSIPDGRPRAFVMRTVKGKGISFMENQVRWHYRSPTSEEFELALAELP